MLETTQHKCFCALALGLFALGFGTGASAQQLSPKLQNAVGHWQVVNSDGSPGGRVDTYIENGKLFGRVTQVRPGRTPQDVCDKCSGEYKNQLILGMVNMRDFHPEGDDWVEGTVVDSSTKARSGPSGKTNSGCEALSASPCWGEPRAG